MTLLAEVAAVSRRVSATRSRIAKVREIAECLRSLEPAEIEPAEIETTEIKGYRPDKRPDEADTIDTVRSLFNAQIHV